MRVPDVYSIIIQFCTAVSEWCRYFKFRQQLHSSFTDFCRLQTGVLAKCFAVCLHYSPLLPHHICRDAKRQGKYATEVRYRGYGPTYHTILYGECAKDEHFCVRQPNILNNAIFHLEVGMPYTKPCRLSQYEIPMVAQSPYDMYRIYPCQEGYKTRYILQHFRVFAKALAFPKGYNGMHIPLGRDIGILFIPWLGCSDLGTGFARACRDI